MSKNTVINFNETRHCSLESVPATLILAESAKAKHKIVKIIKVVDDNIAQISYFIASPA